MTRIMTAMATAALLTFATMPVIAEETVDATCEFSGGSVAAGIGYSWGSGTLHYQGKDYPFSISGLSLANVGASSIDATAKVYHLKKAEDFAGNFTGLGGGAAIGIGGGGAIMQNKAGVMMQVLTKQQGLQFTLASGGVDIKMK
jgi:hypothetical protein